ncbi:MAG: cell envelope integrity protein TolA [Parcubacteria group bacterium]
MKMEKFIPDKKGIEKTSKSESRAERRAQDKAEKKESFSDRVKNSQIEKLKQEEKQENEVELEKVRKAIKEDLPEDWKDDQYESKEELLNAAEQADAEYLATEEGRKKDKKIQKSSKFKRWVARNVIQGALYGGSTLAGIFGAGNNNATAQDIENNIKDPEDLKNKTEMQVDAEDNIVPDDNAYTVTEKDFEGGVGPDSEGVEIEDNIERDLSEQEKEDKKVFEKHEKEWEKNHKYYVRDGEELKSVIRHSLNHLNQAFETPEDLRNSIHELYDQVLSPEEIIDLYSFIKTGAPEEKSEEALNRNDVEYLQSIYNKIADAPSDEVNDKLVSILESNSNKEGGIDDMYGIATGEASNTLILDKIGKILELSGLESDFEAEKVEGERKDVEMKETPEERGYTSITIEKGLDIAPEKAHEIEMFTSKLENFGNFDNLGDFIKNFDTSTFDKIEITGEDKSNNVEYNGEAVDFDTLDDLGTGNYKIQVDNYEVNFDYERGEGGEVKKLSNFEGTYHTENGDIRVSASEAVKDVSAFEGDKDGYIRSLKDFKLDAFGEVQLEIGELYKYENVNEVGGSVDNVNVKIGEWSVSAGALDAKYKTPQGEFDLGKMIDNVWQDKEGAKVGDIIDRFDISSGPITIENADGSTKIEYDGKNFFYNDYRIFKDSEGNFNFLDSKGQGAKYEGGFETYTKVNGQNMETKDFINNLVYGGAEVMLDSPDVEVGLSAMGGFIEMNTGNVESKITEETLAEYRTDINETSQRIADKAESFVSLIEGGNAEGLIDEGLKLKTEIFSEVGDLVGRVGEKGEIEMEDWQVSADFKALAENFKLIGKPDVASSVYKLDVFFSALGNDLGKITIDKNFVDGYKESDNKADFVCENVWGKNVDELKQDFVGRAGAELGAQFLEQPTEKIMSIINATNNGSVEGMTISEDEVQMYYNFSKKLNPEGTNFIVYANANISEQSQDKEAYVNVFDTEGKEHINAGAEYKDYGGIGMIATKVLLNNNEGGTVLKALGGVNVEFMKLQDMSLGFGDGMGNNYKIVDGENFFKMADALAGDSKDLDLVKRAIDNKWVMPVPQAEIGLDVKHDIIGDKGGKTTLEGSAMAATNYLNTSLNLSLRAERDLSDVTGMPLTVGGKIDTNKMLNGARHANASGEVYLRWDIGKNIGRYIGK